MPPDLFGPGSNAVAADDGFGGLVLEDTAADPACRDGAVQAATGGSLQVFDDLTLEHGLECLHALERIRGGMRYASNIFKNVLLDLLPDTALGPALQGTERVGRVAVAFFLGQISGRACGQRRDRDCPKIPRI